MIAQSLQEMRVGYLTVIFGIVSALFAYTIHPETPVAQVFLGLAFAGAVLNLIVSDQSTQTVSDLDIFILLITGFAATAIGAPSVSEEAFYAALRMAFLSVGVGGAAWLYYRVNRVSGVNLYDVKTIAALGAVLPLALTVYTVAFAICLTVTAMAIGHLWRGEMPRSPARVPVASIAAGLVFVVWIVYRFQTGGA